MAEIARVLEVYLKKAVEEKLMNMPLLKLWIFCWLNRVFFLRFARLFYNFARALHWKKAGVFKTTNLAPINVLRGLHCKSNGPRQVSPLPGYLRRRRWFANKRATFESQSVSYRMAPVNANSVTPDLPSSSSPMWRYSTQNDWLLYPNPRRCILWNRPQSRLTGLCPPHRSFRQRPSQSTL